MQTNFETISDDYIIAITTKDEGNDEGETSMQAFCAKYDIKPHNGDSVLATMLGMAARGTLKSA